MKVSLPQKQIKVNKYAKGGECGSPLVVLCMMSIKSWYFTCPDCKKQVHISWPFCPYCDGIYKEADKEEEVVSDEH